MKTFIPKQPKLIRERIEVKLDAPVVKKLEQYCTYLDSDRDYVVAQALDFVFRKDREFTAWLAKQAPKPTFS
jgi:predicted transcriptional regulator